MCVSGYGVGVDLVCSIFFSLGSTAVEAGFDPILARVTGRYVLMPFSSPDPLVQCPGVILSSRVGDPHCFLPGSVPWLTSPILLVGICIRLPMRVPPISLCISMEVLMNIIRSDLTNEATAGVTALPQLSDNADRSERIRSYIELYPESGC